MVDRHWGGRLWILDSYPSMWVTRKYDCRCKEYSHMCVGRNWRGDKRCIDEADYFNYVEICDASHGDTENIHVADLDN